MFYLSPLSIFFFLVMKQFIIVFYDLCIFKQHQTMEDNANTKHRFAVDFNTYILIYFFFHI